MRHALLVVAAPRRQAACRRVQCLAEAGHFAVSEDGPYAGDEGHTGLDLLRTEVADEGLGCGQIHGAHGAPLLRMKAAA